MNKEQIYDEQIDPLMRQIIAIAQEHGIAMLCSYAIPTPEDEDLACTTHLPDGDGNFSPILEHACETIMSDGRRSLALRMTMAAQE